MTRCWCFTVWYPAQGTSSSCASSESERSPSKRADRANLKALRDDVIGAQVSGQPRKPSRRPGLRNQNDLLFFLPVCPESSRGKREGKKRLVGWAFTQGGDLRLRCAMAPQVG